MKKISPTTAVLIIALLIIGFIFFSTYKMITDFGIAYKKESKCISKMIGEKVIFWEDSLEVVDYSIWNGTYTLSNGKYVTKEYVRRHLIRIDRDTLYIYEDGILIDTTWTGKNY